MRRLAVLSDTHVPSRESEIPGFVEQEVEDADEVVHAGDFDSEATYEAVEDLAGGDLVAVRGNMDPVSLGLPAVETLWVDDREFVVVHGSGPLDGYQDRVLQTVREERESEDAIVVSGHTHELTDHVVDGVRHLNPGSATGADPAAEATMLAVDVDGGDVAVSVLRE
ncbi:YfcE family phosphodiesterase [Halobacterium sp. R2-5]|uniref:metallophosphoesterase family protein n=1 Tax=Halobacterium sp. R2-5 TaxID=2715751 RepID=UPI00141F8E5E|nr:YfcE family phosphodiesterase [Halobacterium sp. R2-5]NIB98389.1 YfcE family phosphodiesterase [Halobacterium sp. R2-5]